MANSFFDSSNGDPLAALSADTSTQRSQISQYSILRAAGYLQNNRNDDALKEFKKALAFDPQNTTAWTYIGKINLSKGNTADAIKAFKTAAQIQPTSVDAQMNLGNAYLQDKQYVNSEKTFKAAAKIDPLNTLPSYTLGLQYANTNRLSEAETQFLKVKKIAPKDGNVYYALGMLQNKQGKYEDAAANLEKSLVLKKNFPSANYELGVAYDALGRKDDANKQLTILKTSDPNQAKNLQTLIEKPGMVYMDTALSGGFMSILGPGTPLWMLDPTLLSKPGSGKEFTVTIGFDSEMDQASVTNPQNWSISRSNSIGGGYYNNTMPLKANDAVLPLNPEAVTYNSLTKEATVRFRLNQNSSGNAVIDLSHVNFKFNGKNMAGQAMDTTADEVNGSSGTPF